MSTPSDGDPTDSFTFDELADLRSGVLDKDAERDLRCRIERRPDEARRMIAALDTVERDFPDPSNADDPLDVPAPVAARWQEAIAREAARRAGGATEDHPSTPRTPPTEPDGSPSTGSGPQDPTEY